MGRDRREYMREYQKRWLAKRRAAYLADKRCVDCGGREQLEIDHIVPAEKVNNRVWSWAKDRREAELLKCAVRCRSCHSARTKAQKLLPCGTVAAYKRGCSCPECRAAHREEVRAWRARKAADSPATHEINI